MCGGWGGGGGGGALAVMRSGCSELPVRCNTHCMPLHLLLLVSLPPTLCSVELTFSSNSSRFLASEQQQPTLTKEYTFELLGGSEPRLLSSRVTKAPAWAAPDMDPTQRSVGGDSGKKLRPAASFFQLFKPGGGKYAFNLTGSEKDAQVRTPHRRCKTTQKFMRVVAAPCKTQCWIVWHPLLLHVLHACDLACAV